MVDVAGDWSAALALALALGPWSAQSPKCHHSSRSPNMEVQREWRDRQTGRAQSTGANEPGGHLGTREYAWKACLKVR